MTCSAKLGQNFLYDPRLAGRLADLLPPITEKILEIGPGRGILTERILEKFPQQIPILVEIDPDLYAALLERFSRRVEIIQSDIRAVSLAECFPGGRFFLIGNLPYYLSREIIDWTMAQADLIQGGLFMLQREFVGKILNGDNPANAQAAFFQLLFESRREFNLAPGSFQPRPRVVSTVFRFERRSGILNSTPPGLYPFLKTAFSHPRKTLANNLGNLIPRVHLIESFQKCRVDGLTRPAQLSAERYFELFSVINPGDLPER